MIKCKRVLLKLILAALIIVEAHHWMHPETAFDYLEDKKAKIEMVHVPEMEIPERPTSSTVAMISGSNLFSSSYQHLTVTIPNPAVLAWNYGSGIYPLR